MYKLYVIGGIIFYVLNLFMIKNKRTVDRFFYNFFTLPNFDDEPKGGEIGIRLAGKLKRSAFANCAAVTPICNFCYAVSQN